MLRTLDITPPIGTGSVFLLPDAVENVRHIHALRLTLTADANVANRVITVSWARAFDRAAIGPVMYSATITATNSGTIEFSPIREVLGIAAAFSADGSGFYVARPLPIKQNVCGIQIAVTNIQVTDVLFGYYIFEDQVDS